MAVSVRDVRSSGTGGTNTALNHSVPIPTCVVGDDLYASFTINGGHGAVTDPGGWTRLFPTTIVDDGFMTLLVYRKTATATEVAGGNITVVVGTAARGDYGSISIVNSDPSLPPDGVVTATNLGGTTSVSQSVTASADDSLILSILALDSASENATPTAPLVQQWDPVEAGTLGQANAGATVYSATAGSTTVAWTWTAPIARKHWAAAIRGYAVVVADAAQTQTSTVPALSQVHTLTVDAAVETQTSDVVALVQVQTITTVNDAAQAQTSAVPTLVQIPTLTVADAAQAHTSTVPALSQLQTITTVNAAVQVVTSDEVGLFKAATGTMSASPSAVPSMTFDSFESAIVDFQPDLVWSAACDVTWTSEIVHSGIYSAKLVANGGANPNMGTSTPEPVTAGQQYTVTCWFYPTATAPNLFMDIAWYSGSTQFDDSVSTFTAPAINTWTQLAATFTAPTGATAATRFVGYFGSTPAGTTVYIDEFALQGGPPGGKMTTMTGG